MLPYRESRFIKILLVVFFVLVVGYALYEAQGILYGPSIFLPVETTTSKKAYTIVSGRAERITELRLNGKPIPVTEDGSFEEPYLLADGTNRLIFEARDARGRTTRESLDIVYTPEEEPIPAATSTDVNAIY